MAALVLLCLVFPSSGITIGSQSEPQDTVETKVDSVALDSIEDALLRGELDTSLIAEDDSVVQYESNFWEQLKNESLVLTFPSLRQALSKGNKDKESAESKLKKTEEELQLQIIQDSLDKVAEERMAQEEKERKPYVKLHSSRFCSFSACGWVSGLLRRRRSVCPRLRRPLRLPWRQHPRPHRRRLPHPASRWPRRCRF